MRLVTVQGVSIPALGLGTYRMRGAACAQAVEHALRLGYRHIDCAEAYENEEAVADGIRMAGVAREELFLTSKLSYRSQGLGRVRESLEASLRRLGTPYVNLWLIHWPNSQVPLRETLDTMLGVRNEGRVLHIGVSNFSIELLHQALQCAPILCNQVEYHPYLAQEEMLAFARKHDLLVIAYAPLAEGHVINDPTLAEIAAKRGRTTAQVALRWLIQQKNVAAIPKAKSPQHIAENLGALEFELSKSEMQAIFQLARNRRLVWPDFSPDWRP